MAKKWDKLPEWTKEQVAELVAAVKADFDAGNFSKELSAKLEERIVPEREVYLTITSGKSVIGAYDYYGDARIGFWHPDYELFVAWKPDDTTRLVSAFYRDNGEEYLRSNLEATPIRKGRR